MPRQIQFTKADITTAIIDVIRESGSGAVTARSICKKMGSSVTPLFREFATVEEMIEGARKEAENMFSNFMVGICQYNPAFKEFGLRLVKFSKEEPNLFHFLFLERGGRNAVADSLARECLKQTGASFGLTEEQTGSLFDRIWPFACGLAQLCSKAPEVYTDEKISEMLSAQFQALLMLAKSGKVIKDIEPHLIPEGPRVFLRKWKDSDAAAMYKYACDPDLGPRAGWPPHQSVEESLDVIRQFFTNNTTWAITLKENDEIIGCAGFLLAGTSNMPLAPDEAEVGYWVAKPYWNQGFCTEALGLVIEYCKSLGIYNTLYGEHFIDNPASGRVMEKCGFTDTGLRKTCPALEVGSDKEVRVLKLQL